MKNIEGKKNENNLRNIIGNTWGEQNPSSEKLEVPPQCSNSKKGKN
jgi:hypothetical protein